MNNNTNLSFDLNWRSIFVLTQNTIIKEFRNWRLIFLLVFNFILLFTIFSFFRFVDQNFLATGNGMSELFRSSVAGGQVPDLGTIKIMSFYSFISFFSGLIGLMLGTACIRSDEASNVLQLLLALPLRRSEYLISRVVGTWLIVICFYIISLGTAFLLFAASGDKFSHIGPLLSSMIITLVLVPLPMIMIGQLLSLFLSQTFATMLGLSLTFLLVYCNIHHVSDTFVTGMVSVHSVWDGFVWLVHLIFPRIGVLGKTAQEILMEKPLTVSLPLEIFHYIFSCGLLFFITLGLFKRKHS